MINFLRTLWRKIKRSKYQKYSKELRHLVSASHTLNLNANDFFDYASADEELLSEYDVVQLLPLIRKYKQDAIHAYMSYSRGWLPLPPYRTKKFYTALDEVKKIKWEFND